MIFLTANKSNKKGCRDFYVMVLMGLCLKARRIINFIHLKIFFLHFCIILKITISLIIVIILPKLQDYAVNEYIL